MVKMVEPALLALCCSRPRSAALEPLWRRQNRRFTAFDHPGKTAVVTSLVLANLSSAKRVPDAAFKKAMSGDGSGGELADYPISLIITNNTLVQQWHGERPPHLALAATAAAHTCRP